ncbi:hypothetical protein HPB52_015490 [Rhipicephalus sanguineus]|uniref:Tartrate-resistant acid phosphatase type 5 n=1 Tax=Rhipicephalus sanguineus TaxID=34632 RepID=A0A9D4PIY5_RHISA|nr:hypothetical protein HPB52_015490 [Rhipicephalus sanguineus]
MDAQLPHLSPCLVAVQRTFEDVYSAPSLQVPWLIVAGNHDHDGNVSAQIEYSKRSKRWHFPFYYYNRTYQIPGAANHTLDILMLDTVLLCGNTDPEDEESQPANRNEALYNRQFRWIDKNLAQSKEAPAAGDTFACLSTAQKLQPRDHGVRRRS